MWYYIEPLILMDVKKKKDRDGMEIEMEMTRYLAITVISESWKPAVISDPFCFHISVLLTDVLCCFFEKTSPSEKRFFVAFIDLWKDLDGGRLSKFQKCIAKCFKFLFSFYFLLELWNSISNTMRNKTFWGPELAFSVTMVLKNLNK